MTKPSKTKSPRWIKCGLPFYGVPAVYDDPPFPDLSVEEKAEFGTTPAERKKEALSSDDWSKVDDEFASPLRERLGEEYDWDYTRELFYEELDKLAKKASKAKAKLINQYVKERTFKLKYDAWSNDQPKVIAWHEAIEKLRAEHTPKSFSGLGLDKPGVLIEIKEGRKTNQYLIGDINTNRGVCDDCVAFERDAIVKRYKIVWSAK